MSLTSDSCVESGYCGVGVSCSSTSSFSDCVKCNASDLCPPVVLQIIGIVIGVLILLGIIIAIVVCCMVQRRTASRRNNRNRPGVAVGGPTTNPSAVGSYANVSAYGYPDVGGTYASPPQYSPYQQYPGSYNPGSPGGMNPANTGYPPTPTLNTASPSNTGYPTNSAYTPAPNYPTSNASVGYPQQPVTQPQV